MDWAPGGAEFSCGLEELSSAGSCRKVLGDIRPALPEAESTGCDESRGRGGQTRRRRWVEGYERVEMCRTVTSDRRRGWVWAVLGEADGFRSGHGRLQAWKGHQERVTSRQPDEWATDGPGETLEMVSGSRTGPGVSSTVVDEDAEKPILDCGHQTRQMLCGAGLSGLRRSWGRAVMVLPPDFVGRLF